MSHSRPSREDELEGLELTPPGEGFELYRHRKASGMRTEGWHGCYWARRTEGGAYEIRTVPSLLGEPPAPGGTFPMEGFEKHYEKVDL
ncbi:MAG: hypothetical protein M3305_00555 [Actinomycetota bacterium]|nr:hypothetical protein [Actinomycetota bacterium]